MVISKLSQIPRYSSCNPMGRSVKCEILVISVDGDNVRSGQKDMSPSSKSMDDREEFPVVDIVISFCLIKGTGHTSDGSKSALIVFLRENSPCRELRCVYFEEKGAFVVWSL